MALRRGPRVPCPRVSSDSGIRASALFGMKALFGYGYQSTDINIIVLENNCPFVHLTLVRPCCVGDRWSTRHLLFLRQPYDVISICQRFCLQRIEKISVSDSFTLRLNLSPTAGSRDAHVGMWAVVGAHMRANFSSLSRTRSCRRLRRSET